MRPLVAVALGIAALDLLQVVVFDWRPKHVGALGGAAIYLLVAAGAAGDRRWAALVAAAMPVIPLGVLALWAAGAPVPAAPDAAMVGILGLQLAAAALGFRRLRAAASTAE